MRVLRANVLSLTQPQNLEAVAASGSDQDDVGMLVCEGRAVYISLCGCRDPVAGIVGDCGEDGAVFLHLY